MCDTYEHLNISLRERIELFDLTQVTDRSRQTEGVIFKKTILRSVENL